MYLIGQIELGRIPGYENDSQAREDDDSEPTGVEESVEATFRWSAKSFKPHHYFDYIVGTSTGGLSAIMLGRLEKDVDFALAQYDTIGEIVFAHPRPSGSISTRLKVNRLVGLIRTKYSETRKKEAILSVIRNTIPRDKQSQMHEERLTLKHDEQRCKTFVVSYGSPEVALKLATLFRSYELPRERGKDNTDGPGDVPLWAAARATSAAPFYFEPLKLYGAEYIDGGIVANNPALLAYEEMRRAHAMKPLQIVSIGTGESRPAADYKKPAQLGKWNIFKVLADVATQSEDTHSKLEFRLKGVAPKVHYLRLNVENPELAKVQLDSWEPRSAKNGRGGHKTKDNITNLTKEYLKSPKVNSDLLDCAKRLVAVRRKRAESPEWELYACRIAYFCKHPDCINSKHPTHHETRHLLREHVKKIHGFIVDDGSSDPVQCSVGPCCHTARRPLFRRSESLEDFRDHLNRIHGISRASLKDPEEFENWLSSCRELK
ncbi:Calcium-independent phospholipase a2-gamma [Lasiodiplodia theobromae]|uniref:Calcium-independent phospholipase a2-gamma n=1 Tax=Lasiodiplodia theobromae TaxID=45133 RepID=UPI0015C3A1AF|nr:Calcium-independent phospholipase a2-gamma [Lasiodiplodia theobromae]KAF4539652.1 Calcium-independent phospholipase a2-gamma [Lasiodiplodia theobromae]